VEITKIDAARRQLETAIVLYFHEADPVSIHSLACAAYDVLLAVNRASNGTPMIKDWLPDMVEPDLEGEFRRFLNMAQNFFKHADKDPHAVLDFLPAHTDVLMLDACWAYRRIAGERLPILATFETWAGMTFARAFVTYPGTEKMDPAFLRRMASLPRAEFFAQMLPVAHQVQLDRPGA
jgi:hypothetical protein